MRKFEALIVEMASQLRRLTSLAAICTITLVSPTQSTGVTLSWGIIGVYLASYLRLSDSRTNLNEIAAAPFVSGITWALGTIVATWSFHRFGGRTTIATGTLIYAGGLCGASFLTDMYAFLAVLLVTAGFGPAMMCIPANYMSWITLPGKKGLATGFTWLFYGFGGVLYGVFFTFLVNPYNESPDRTVSAGNQTEKLFTESVAGRVPMAMRISAGIILAMGIGGALFVLETEEKEARKHLSASISAKEIVEEPVSGCPSLSQALKTRSFYSLFLFCWLAFQFSMVFLYQYKNYELEYSSNDHLLSLTGTIGLFANSWARFFISWLADYFSFRTLMLCILGAMTALALTVHLVVQYPYVYAVWVCMVLAGHGGIYAPVTLVCGQIYGTTVGSKVFSIVAQGLNLGSLLMVPVSLCIIQVYATQPYGYNTAFYILASAPALAMLLALSLRTQYSWGAPNLYQPLTLDK
jgi:MFS family permease